MAGHSKFKNIMHRKGARLASATTRARGFRAAILNSDGQSVFEQDAESARGASFWAKS